MGASETGQRLARMAKIRLYSNDDGGPPFSVHWHWQGWDETDGTVLDQNGGSYTGDADEVIAELVHLMGRLHTHMLRGMSPFPTIPGGWPSDMTTEQGVEFLKRRGWADAKS